MDEKLDFLKGDGLIPAIIQDDLTRKVLMLGYMNEESLRITRETGWVTFFSRSRDTLWTKGETSGNSLRVKKIIADCDRDTLLIMARPSGPVCHDGPDTCFNEINQTDLVYLDYLQDVIRDRKHTMPDGSYTANLFKQGTAKIAQKVGEEAVELIIEAMTSDDEAFLSESADLLYHLIVLLVDRGWSLQDVSKVLASRHKKK